jgi:3-isopropylmalate/(R)-2-methylmalate dehydratase small subunit
MEKFTVVTGLVAPLDRANVDTDQIIPKQFLKSIKRSGFGPNLFDEWRYLDEGYPGQDNSKRPVNHGFRAEPAALSGREACCWPARTSVVVPREHAPWALQEYGFRAVIASSFADIFFNNCFKNGVLPVSAERRAGGRTVQGVRSQRGLPDHG